MSSDRPAAESRPATALVVGVFLLLAAVVALITGVSLLFPGPVWDGMWNLNHAAYIAFQTMGRLSGALLLALGATAGAAGTGLIKRRKWAWRISIALFAVNGLGDLVTLLVTRDLIRGGSGVLIAGAFIFCLTRPGAKRAFR